QLWNVRARARPDVFFLGNRDAGPDANLLGCHTRRRDEPPVARFPPGFAGKLRTKAGCRPDAAARRMASAHDPVFAGRAPLGGPGYVRAGPAALFETAARLPARRRQLHHLGLPHRRRLGRIHWRQPGGSLRRTPHHSPVDDRLSALLAAIHLHDRPVLDCGADPGRADPAVYDSDQCHDGSGTGSRERRDGFRPDDGRCLGIGRHRLHPPHRLDFRPLLHADRFHRSGDCAADRIPAGPEASEMSSARKAVCLLSGGLDSATCLALARRNGFDCYALSFDYGQRHRVELEAAGRVAPSLGASQHRTLVFGLRQFGHSALTADVAVPKGRSADEMGAGIPITYVPARNTIFLSFALAWAEVLEAADVFIGVNALDYSGYPDCRPEYIDAFECLANLATKSRVKSNRRLKIHTPLIYMTKADIIRTGLSLGVDYSMTMSCYDPSEDGKACGRCDACLLRAKGFAELGIKE